MGLRDAGRRAGVEHRPQRRAHRRLARLGRGDDRRPAVRLLDADELQRRRRGLVGPARPRRLGRRRDDVARPDGLEQRLDVAARLRALRHRDAGHLGRGDREAVEPLARGARPDLVRVAPARRARDRRGALREGGRPDRARRAGAGRRRRRSDADARPLRGRRGGAARDDAREDGVAAAGVHPGRRRDGRELVPDRRRLGGRARRLGGEGVASSGSSRGRGSSPSASSASTRT